MNDISISGDVRLVQEIGFLPEWRRPSPCSERGGWSVGDKACVVSFREDSKDRRVFFSRVKRYLPSFYGLYVTMHDYSLLYITMHGYTGLWMNMHGYTVHDLCMTMQYVTYA